VSIAAHISRSEGAPARHWGLPLCLALLAHLPLALLPVGRPSVALPTRPRTQALHVELEPEPLEAEAAGAHQPPRAAPKPASVQDPERALPQPPPVVAKRPEPASALPEIVAPPPPEVAAV
jgi:hypothetical protein